MAETIEHVFDYSTKGARLIHKRDGIMLRSITFTDGGGLVVTSAMASPITLFWADYCMWVRKNKRFVTNIQDAFSPDDRPVDDVGFRLNRKPNGNVSLKMFHTGGSPVY